MKIRCAPVLAAAFLVVGLVATAAAQRTSDPSRWADAIAAFDADAASRPSGAIVLTGSSSFARWRTMEEDLAPLTVVPRGFGGSTMADVLHYVDRLVMPYKPRAVVIYEGDNDTFFGVSPETIRRPANGDHREDPRCATGHPRARTLRQAEPGSGERLGEGARDHRLLQEDCHR